MNSPTISPLPQPLAHQEQLGTRRLSNKFAAMSLSQQPPKSQSHGLQPQPQPPPQPRYWAAPGDDAGTSELWAAPGDDIPPALATEIAIMYAIKKEAERRNLTYSDMPVYQHNGKSYGPADENMRRAVRRVVCKGQRIKEVAFSLDVDGKALRAYCIFARGNSAIAKRLNVFFANYQRPKAKRKK